MASRTGIPVLASIGHGGLKEGQVINKMIEECKQKITTRGHRRRRFLMAIGAENKKCRSPAKQQSKSGIIVKGIHDVAVRFSKCCSPVPGDEIVGFVTRGRGVSIHRTDCINIINLAGDGEGAV